MNRYEEAMKQLDEKLGLKDGLISLSTIALDKGAYGRCRPAARIVDAYYQDGAFYTVTNAASGVFSDLPEELKMEESALLKAREEGIAVISSPLSAYALCARMAEAGIPA